MLGDRRRRWRTASQRMHIARAGGPQRAPLAWAVAPVPSSAHFPDAFSAAWFSLAPAARLAAARRRPPPPPSLSLRPCQHPSSGGLPRWRLRSARVGHVPPTLAGLRARVMRWAWSRLLLRVRCRWLLAIGYWLLAVGCWLLAAGCWLLAFRLHPDAVQSAAALRRSSATTSWDEPWRRGCRVSSRRMRIRRDGRRRACISPSAPG